MASRNVFTEEGRTRFRNFGLRLRSYLILFLILGALSGAAYFLKWTRGEMAALERMYFRQYVKASVMSKLMPDRPGKYVLLTSGTIGVTDALVYQVLDGQGKGVRNQYGWVFRPHSGVKIEEPRWRQLRSPNGQMESWLRSNIYGGESLGGLFAPALAVCLMTAATGMGIALVVDQRINRMYERGRRLRGARLVTPAEYERETNEADGLTLVVKNIESKDGLKGLMRKAVGRSEPVWRLRMKRNEEAQGMLILGDIGSGKSQILHRYLRQIGERGEAAVIYDPACEFIKAHYHPKRGDVILNPLDERSPFWSPAFEHKYRTDYQVLAEAFFPGRKAEKMQPTEQFFLNASREIFARLLEFEPPPEELIEWLGNEEAIDAACARTELANYIKDDAAPQRAGVLGSLARVGKTLRILPRHGDCEFDFSLTEWAENRRGWIFLTATKETEERLRPLYRAYLDLLMRRLMSVDEAWGKTRPVKLVVDEVHTLEYLPTLYQATTEGRKFGLHVFQGAQNKHQYDDHYGRQAPTMLSCPRYTIVLRCKEPDSGKWLSTLLGEEEIERPRTGVTASVSDQGRDSINYSSQIERRAVVSIEEIGGLEDLTGYWKRGEAVVPFRFDHTTWKKIAEGFVPRELPTAIKEVKEAKETTDDAAAPGSANRPALPVAGGGVATTSHSQGWE